MAKGNIIYTWAMVLFIIFATSMIFLYFTDIYYNQVKPVVINGINNATNDTANQYNILHSIDISWYWAPIILVIGAIIYALAKSQKVEPQQQQSAW